MYGVDGECVEGDIQLVNGRSESEGRVLVCHQGAMKIVCDSRWDDNAAAVVCAQLGYNREGDFYLIF